MVTAAMPRDSLDRAIEQHRRALRFHCYQMLGSLADAEDLVQDAVTRAFAARDEFAGRADVKTWLYRIATHACIDELRRRKRRKLTSTSKPNTPSGQTPEDGDPDAWVQPFPDALLPEQRVARIQAVTLAFVAALQWLPARQRAVLVLRDSLDFTADEVAELLGMTATAVHSSLIRARDRIKEKQAGRVRPPATREEMAVARRFAAAYERNDLEALAAMLRADVEAHMPPIDLWLQGREVFLDLMPKLMWHGREITVAMSRANGRPATRIYDRGKPLALVVIELDRKRQISRLYGFLQPTLVPWFAS